MAISKLQQLSFRNSCIMFLSNVLHTSSISVFVQGCYSRMDSWSSFMLEIFLLKNNVVLKDLCFYSCSNSLGCDLPFRVFLFFKGHSNNACNIIRLQYDISIQRGFGYSVASRVFIRLNVANL